jgi:hypothetical protein
MAQQVASSSSALPDASANETSAQPEARGKLDAVSVLYVLGGIPAILGFLVLLFAVGVRSCGLPA